MEHLVNLKISLKELNVLIKSNKYDALQSSFKVIKFEETINSNRTDPVFGTQF